MIDYSIKVPAIGPADAKIMLVGEGPGQKELEAGEPFVGSAGKELDAFLAVPVRVHVPHVQR